MSAPLLDVDDLALDGPAGPVFTLGAFTLARGELAVLQGPAGSGRSSALLALTGRMKGLRGHGRFDGLDLIRDARRIRRRTAVGRITGLVDVEPRLTVDESITERALTEGVGTDAAEQAVRAVEELVQRPVERRALIETMGALDRAVLTLALACVRPADLIVVDDVDAGLDGTDLSTCYAALLAVAATGPAVLVSAVSAAAVPTGTQVVPLGRRGAAVPDRTPSSPTAPAPAPTPTEEN